MMVNLAANPAHGLIWMGFACFNLLVALATVEKTIPGMLTNWGAPGRMARYLIARALPADATARQKWWTRALAGTRQARDLAAREMLAAPEEAAAMSGPIGALAFQDREKMTPELIEILARMGSGDADAVLQTLSLVGSGPQQQWAKDALAKREAARQSALQRLAEPLAPAAPTAEDALLSAARAKLAAPAENLAERLRAQALAEALETAERSSGDERRLALERVSALMSDGAGAQGSNALPDGSPRLGAPLWAALAAAALALAAGFIPALTTLAGLSPLLAGAGALAGGGALAASMSRPLDFRDPRVTLGPREESSALPEWIPAQRALGRLVERLGLAAERRPSLALWNDAPGDPRPSGNGWSGGLSVDARAVVAVGERWLSAPQAALEGLLAHELGHLATGEQRWRNVWARLEKASRWSALAALASVPAAGWLWAAAAGGAWLACSLLGFAYLRRAELRADRFSAALAGPASARAFLDELERFAPRSTGFVAFLERFLSDHPSLDKRKEALGAGLPL